MSENERGQQFTRIFYIATFFGLASGISQVAVYAFEKFVLGQYVHSGLVLISLVPIVNVFFFWAFGLVLGLIAAIGSKRIPSWFPIFVLAFFFFLSLLVMATWLQWIALTILSVGLAAETTRLIRDHPDGFRRVVRYGVGWSSLLRRRKAQAWSVAPVPALVDSEGLTRRGFLLSSGTMLAALAVGSTGKHLLGDAVALAEMPPAPAAAPNILLIVLDTVRAPSMSLYGYERRTTPNLERLAQGGVLFERALSTVSWTLPSHASMFTGRYPHEMSADRKTPLDATWPTLGELLSRVGYLTAGFIANIEYVSAESGLGRGFLEYDDYDLNPGNFALASSLGTFVSQRPRFRRLVNNWDVLGRKSAAQVNAEFLTWLDNKGPRPFFAFLNYYDAHSPYYPPEPFNTAFGPTTPRDSPLAEQWIHAKDVPPQVLRAENNAYDGAVAYVDEQVGRVVDEISKRGILDNTLIIITSDHGEEFGEHGIFSHGQSLYLPSLHVPLLILYPRRVPAGVRVARAVSLGDVAATVMDLANRENKTIPGTSLAREWASSSGGRAPSPDLVFSELKFAGGFPDWFPIAKGSMRSLVADGYHYIRNGDGSEELYNGAADPWEQQDLAARELDRLSQFRGWLASFANSRPL